MLDNRIINVLIEEAFKARTMAYAPYSKYMVGAALIVPSGKIYTGCNVENASYGLSNCAERTAVFKAVSEGQRHIDAIAIVGGTLETLDSTVIGKEEEYAYPCGACRQVLSEFLPESGDMAVIVARSATDYKELRLSELLTYSFRLS